MATAEEFEVIFKVRRYSPEKGEWWQEYKLTLDKYASVLEGLRKIKTSIDPSLAYRASCRMAICGSCGMRINGEPRLACKTNVKEIITQFGSNTITIEPMDYFKVIKDLVVDWDEFYDRMFKVKPRLYPAQEVLEGKAEHRLKPEDQEVLWKFGQCIWCGLCVSACPAIRIDENFLGPAAHAKGFRFLADPRDTIFEERLKILIDSSWRCTYCYQCYHVCPRDIEPVTAIKKTRQYSRYLKEKTEVVTTGIKHSEAIAESIRNTGILEEAKVYVKTYGLLRTLTDMVYILKVKELNQVLVKEKKVERIDEIKKIMGEE
ncbi:MAG: succinate dehydrogenase/fumarate reductase iron-sulfur subunit [Sulfolobaceae archaeon]